MWCAFRILSFVFFASATVASATDLPEAPRGEYTAEEVEQFLLDAMPAAPQNPLPSKIMTTFKLQNRMIQLWAEKMRSESSLIVAEGSVSLKVGNVELLAQEIRLEPETQKAVAVGRAIMRNGTSVIVCDGIEIDLQRETASTGPLILALYGKNKEALLAKDKAVSYGTMPSKGRMLLVSGEQLQGQFQFNAGQPSLVVEDAWASPCACQTDQEPAWAVRVSRLALEKNEDLQLTMPVFEMFGVPMGWLPVAWVPLGTRRSGILPTVFQLRDGLWTVQPVYLTLGRSFDTTLAPGFVLNRGARFEGEARWHPMRGQVGQLNLIWQHDRLAPQDHLDQEDPIHRLAARMTHTGRWGNGSRFHMDLKGVTDKKVPIELAAEFGERVLAYTRSGAQVSWRRDNLSTSLSSAVFQDLRQKQFSFLEEQVAIRAQEFLRGRFGSVTERLAGPLYGSFNLGTDFVAPVGDIEDRQLERGTGGRFFAEGDLAVHQGARWGTAFGRLKMRGAQQLNDETGDTGHMAYGHLSSGLRTRLVGEGNLLGEKYLHEVLPEILWAQIPWQTNEGYTPFDSDDRLIEGGEVAATVHQKFFPLATPSNYLALSTSVGNPTELEWQPTWSADLDLRKDAWRLSWEGMGRVQEEQLDGFRFRTRMPLFAGFNLHLGWWRLNEDRPRSFYRHQDEPLAGWSVQQPGSPSVRDRLDAKITMLSTKKLRLTYEAAFSSPDFTWGNWDADYYLLTHGGKVEWTAPCDCMSLETRIRFWPNRTDPEIRFSVALSALGETVEIF